VLGLDLDERAEAVAVSVEIALTYIADRALSPIRAPWWLPTPALRRARAAAAALRQLTNDILQACRTDPLHDAPLVRALMGVTDPVTGEALSDEEICNELIVFIIAGHDTTATALAYTLWALGRHPDIQERVAAEVADMGDRELTPEDVPRLGYTVQVLHEALRLCPSAAAVSRVALQDMDVDGYRVQAGDMLAVGIYAVHRDPSLWDDPLTFDPERFSPANAKGRDRWHYLPFGAGPRSCIGDHFAMLEATLALATIIRRREIQSLGADFPIATPFTTVAAGPIMARVRSRADVENARR
jgi:cytochrome P450